MSENWDEAAVDEVKRDCGHQHEIDRYIEVTAQRKKVYIAVMVVTAFMLIAGYCAVWEVFALFKTEGGFLLPKVLEAPFPPWLGWPRLC